jgi:flagellar motor switch protein FliM
MNPQSDPTPAAGAMSQSEIEKLLASVGGQEEAAAASISASAAGASPGGHSSLRHEFPSVSTFSAAHLRFLRVQHEEYIRSLEGQLSAHLRMECSLHMSKLETMRFQDFMQGLSNPTHLGVFQPEPLPGICLLDLPPKLALSLIDRELGGPGMYQDDSRELTKMEARLLTRVVDIIVDDWCSGWREMMEFRAKFLRFETSPRFVRTHQRDQTLLALGIEVRIGGLVEQMHLAFPHSVLDPLLAKMDMDLQSSDTTAKSQPETPLRWNPTLEEVPIHVTAEWLGGVELTARQLGELKAGTILPMTFGSKARVQILLEKKPKFMGNLGTAGKRLAVKVDEALST